MNKNVFKQYDTRWGSLPYPVRPYTLARSGCGCCAVTHCIIELEKYKKYTPKTVRPYMKQFATKGNGTLWSGITKSLQHYGYKVSNPNIGKSMKPAWDILNKKGALKRGVLLFSGRRGPDGTLWTAGGHYVAFVNYKVVDGKHYFYTKDSGGRNHTGWYCYEKSMQGALPQIWICTSTEYKGLVPTKPVEKKFKKPTTKYKGTIPAPTLKKGSSGTKVKNLQKFLNWYLGLNLTVDGEFGGSTESALINYQKTEGISKDGVWGKTCQTHAKAYLPSKSVVTTTPTTTKKKTGKIADVSAWQENIDFAKASKELDGVILRSSYTGQSSFTIAEDKTFKTNLKKASKNKLPIGVYHYSQAVTVTEAKKEAEFVCKKLKEYKADITLPVVFDWEFGGRLNSSKAKNLGKKKCTDICIAFCEVVKKNGYTPMVYANYSTFTGYLNYSTLKKKYLIWLAQYSSKADLDYDYWQYTSSGKVSGIQGNVDLNKKK